MLFLPPLHTLIGVDTISGRQFHIEKFQHSITLFIIILKNISEVSFIESVQPRTSASQAWANSIPFSNTQADLPLLGINIVVVPLSFTFTTDSLICMESSSDPTMQHL